MVLDDRFAEGTAGALNVKGCVVSVDAVGVGYSILSIEDEMTPGETEDSMELETDEVRMPCCCGATEHS